MRVIGRHSTGIALRAILTTADGGPRARSLRRRVSRRRLRDLDAAPRLLDDDVAEVLVRVRGSSVCSGTPITGTPTRHHGRPLRPRRRRRRHRRHRRARRRRAHATGGPRELPVPRRSEPAPGCGRAGAWTGRSRARLRRSATPSPRRASSRSPASSPSTPTARCSAARRYDDRPTAEGRHRRGRRDRVPVRPVASIAASSIEVADRPAEARLRSHPRCVGGRTVRRARWQARPARDHLDGRSRPLVQRPDATGRGARAVGPSRRVHARARR